MNSEAANLETDLTEKDTIKDVMLDLIKDGKNSKLVACKRCGSKILRPEMANYVEEEYFVPFMKKTKSSNSSEGEMLPKFWAVDNMYTFENVGFSNTVGDTKYLICADCEIGPIGLHDTATKMSYVALDRVNYEVESENTTG